MIESDLFTLLTHDAAIAALVASRVYPVQLAEDAALPALSYQIVSAVGEPTMETSGLQRWRLQLDCWGDTYADASTLRQQVALLLDGYQGDLASGVRLQNAQAMQRIDFFDDMPRVYRCMIEFYLWFDFYIHS